MEFIILQADIEKTLAELPTGILLLDRLELTKIADHVEKIC